MQATSDDGLWKVRKCSYISWYFIPIDCILFFKFISILVLSNHEFI